MSTIIFENDTLYLFGSKYMSFGDSLVTKSDTIVMITNNPASTRCFIQPDILIICVALVLITLIIARTFICWKYIEKLSKEKEFADKKDKETEEKTREKKAKIVDKLLNFLEKETADDKESKIKEFDSEECKAYRKVLSTLTGIPIPEK